VSAKKTRQKSRIYWRDQGGERRAYADFRDIGGKRIPLIPEGDRRATTDELLAEQLAAKELEKLMSGKRDREAGKTPSTPRRVCGVSPGREGEEWEVLRFMVAAFRNDARCRD
jgi:hypothetical protein